MKQKLKMLGTLAITTSLLAGTALAQGFGLKKKRPKPHEITLLRAPGVPVEP